VLVLDYNNTLYITSKQWIRTGNLPVMHIVDLPMILSRSHTFFILLFNYFGWMKTVLFAGLFYAFFISISIVLFHSGGHLLHVTIFIGSVIKMRSAGSALLSSLFHLFLYLFKYIDILLISLIRGVWFYSCIIISWGLSICLWKFPHIYFLLAEIFWSIVR